MKGNQALVPRKIDREVEVLQGTMSNGLSNSMMSSL